MTLLTRISRLSPNRPATSKPAGSSEPATSPDAAGSSRRGAKLRPADPDRRDRRGTMPAGTVLVVMLGALAGAAVLNAGPMLERAETSELGPGRDLRIGFWEPVEAFSATVGLDVPRSLLDALTGNEGPGAGQQGVEIVAGAPSRPQLGHSPLDLPPASPAAEGAGHDDAGGEGSTPAGPVILPPRAEPETGSGTGGSSTRTPLGLPSVVGQEVDDVEDEEPDSDAAESDTPETNTTQTEVSPGAEADSAASPFSLRRPTADEPLRILIAGDSTTDAVGTAMLRELSTTGVTDARLDFRVSTGLSRPDFFDWPAHLREIRATAATEVFVIMIGANDAQPILVDGEVEQHGSERWFAAYRQRVAALLDEFTTDGGWVIWIGQPVMRNDPYDARLQGLNQVYAEEAARYPSAVYIDPRPATSAEDGSYTAYLPDAEGNQELIRQTDGVHLTPDGGERIAPIVIEEINRIAPLY